MRFERTFSSFTVSGLEVQADTGAPYGIDLTI